MKRALLFTALIVWSAMASAVVYKWTDTDGKVHFGDRPPDGVKAEVVELLGSRQPSPAPPPPPSARPAATPGAATSTAGNASAKAAAQQVDPDAAAAARSAQCDAAQARLKQLTEGRHLFKTGTNGEREYLTSDQINTERADASAEIAQVCGST